MKKLSTILLISLTAVFLLAGSAMGTYISHNSWDCTGKDLQSVLDDFAADGSVWLNNTDTSSDFASRYFGLYLDGLDAGDPFSYQSALSPEGMYQIVTFREPRRHIPPFPRGKPPSPVPEPATMLLVGSGLIGLAGLGRRKFFKKN
jgi:hypothetical protein